MDEKSIFNHARNISNPDAREAYLRAVCGDDAEALKRIQGLLDADASDTGFLENPPADLGATQSLKDPKSQVGQRIGPYKLLQEIGEGGMGTVYMADQIKPVKRRVALKIIKAGMDSKQVIARFEAERQALAMMDHQNIAKILDAGMTEDGRPYFAMELVQGVPITKYCDRNKLTPNARLKLFIPVCKAIQHAHQKGIIHRDIKPSNVLVSLYDGQPVPKVIDFGLAKALQHEVKLTDKTMFTEFGQIVGTIQYMSPEQAEMNELNVDTRTDIYSLGVMLYELLTGSTPLDKSTLKEQALIKLLDVIKHQEPPRPSTRLSESGDAVTGISEQRKIAPAKLQQLLRGELDWVVMKALEKDRTRRYESADGFAEDINRYLNDEVVVARPPSTGYKVRKFVKKNRGLVAALTTIAALLIAAVAFSSWFANEARIARNKSEEKTIEVTMERDRANEERDRADEERDRATEEEQLAALEARKAREAENLALRNLYVAKISQTAEAARSGNAKRARTFLDQCPERFRNWEWGYLRNVIHSGSQIFQGDIGTIRKDDLGLTPNIRSYAYSLCKSPAVFSPDTTTIAIGDRKGRVTLIDVNTGRTLKELLGKASPVTSAIFTADSTKIIIGSNDGSVSLWNIADGNRVWTLEGGGPVVDLDIAPESDRVAIAWEGENRIGEADIAGQVRIVETRTGKEIRTSPAELKMRVTGMEVMEKGTTSAISFSPDGNHLVEAWGNHYGTISVWNTNTGEVVLDIPPLTSLAREVCYSTDGKWIAAVFFRDKDIVLYDAKTGARIRTLSGHTAPVSSLAFKNGDSQIISTSADETVRVWETETGQLLHTFLGHQAGIVDGGLSSNEELMATVSDDGGVRLWTLAERNGARDISMDTNVIDQLGFVKDDDLVVGDGMNNLRFIELRTGKNVGFFSVANDTLSTNGRYLATGGGNSRRVRFWDLNERKTVRSFVPSDLRPSIPGVGFIREVAVSNDGRLIADCFAGVNKKILLTIWDCDSGNEFWDIDIQDPEMKSSVKCLEFSPDDSVLAGIRIQTPYVGATKVDGQLVLWDLENKKKQLTIDLEPGVRSWSIAFSPDGGRIAVGVENTAIVYETTRGTKVAEFRGHQSQDGINSIEFSPDGTRIVTAASDGTRLWLADTGDELLKLIGTVACFSSGGSQVATGLTDRSNRQDYRGLVKLHSSESPEKLTYGEITKDWHWRQFLALKSAKSKAANFHFASLLKAEPNEWRLHYHWGYMHFLDENYEEAIEHFSRAIEVDSTVALAWYQRGNSYLKLSDWNNALINLEKAVELDAQPYSMKLLAWMQCNHENKSMRDLDRAIELANRTLIESDGWDTWVDPSTKLTLANALYRANRFQETIDTIEPPGNLRDGNHFILIAMAYWKLDNKEEAIDWLNKATKSGIFISERGWNYGEKDKELIGEAIPLFEYMIEQLESEFGRDHDDTLLAVASLGLNHQYLGDVDRALPLLSEAYESSKSSESTKSTKRNRGFGIMDFGIMLIEGYIAAKKPERAIAIANDLVKIARAQLPDNSEQLADRLAIIGSTLVRSEAFSDAAILLRECLDIRQDKIPDSWLTFNAQSLLGDAFLGQRKYSEAESLLVSGCNGFLDREQELPRQARFKLTESLQRIVDLYESWNKAEPEMGYDIKAVSWQRKLDASPFKPSAVRTTFAEGSE